MKAVLSIDGGGIRGIIPATVLSYIEEQLHRPISKAFDLTVGTSTGGIISLALNVDDGRGSAKYSASDVVSLYEENGTEIFDSSLWKKVSSIGGNISAKYSSEGLERVLNEYFGYAVLESSLSLSMVTTYDIEKRKPVFLKSWKKQFAGVLMKEAARATSAAPTYFEPALIKVSLQERALIDGGVCVNNPSVSAYSEAKRIFNSDEEYMIVSLGTGEQVRPINYSQAKEWGRIGWAVPALSCVFDGVSDTAHYQMNQILGHNYYRLQTTLEHASDDMDDVSEENINNLMIEAKKLIEHNKRKIDIILHQLEKI